MIVDEPGPPPTWATHACHPADPDTLTALAAADPSDLTGPELVDAIVASEKALSLLAGRQMRLMAALAVPFVAGDPTRLAARMARKNCITGDDNPDNVELFVDEAATCLAASEIAAALRISPVTSGIRVREADTMTTVLAPTLHALEAGKLDRGKARIIAEHCQPLSPENTADLQDLVLPEAAELSTSELRELAGEAVIIVDPEGSEDRHRAAAARRDLTLRAQPDAMATLSAFLTADAAVKIFQISDLLATSTAGTPGDTRGIGARRIDAWVDIADFIGQPIPDSTIPTASRKSNPRTPDDTINRTGTHHETAADATEATGSESTCAAESPGAADCDAVESAGVGAGPRSESPEGVGTDQLDAEPEPSVGRLRSAAGASIANTTPADRRSGTSVAAGSAPAPAFGGRAAAKARSRRALTRQGRRPHLSVTIGLNTLAGLNELPGKLAGFGAIPASLARAIASSAGTITALITDPTTGIATDAGTLTYRPTQKLRDQIAALLNTCQFPSCRQPVWRCDIDHREPFDHQNPESGGHTDKENTGPFCRRHHLIKHHADWQIHVSKERFTLDWTSPTGHRYSTKPRPAAVPDIRKMTGHITHSATAIAERLDTLTAFNNASNNPDNPPETTIIEELTTALLLQHHLNQPEMHYDPDDTLWGRTATDDLTNDRDDNPDRCDGVTDAGTA